MRAARSRDALPLAVWAGVLSGTTVLGTTTATVGVLGALGRLDLRAVEALAVGAVVGLLLSTASVVAAARLAAAVRALHADALRRLHEPSAPVVRPAERPSVVRLSSELAGLARVLDALHLRVRVADDLGERRRIEAATAGAGVQELLSGLVAAEEGARGQLAAELHDTVAQSLMIARGLLAAGPTTSAEVGKVADFVEDAEEQVRAVMARTRPPALREGDLASAVGGLRADVRARYALDVHVDWPVTPLPLPLSAAVTIYRFYQEALLNVVKHADVDDAWLGLHVEDDSLVATVRDDGPGFDPGTVRPDRGRHVGLGLLRERARLSGGALDVQSGPSAGTVLRLRLPRPVGATPEAGPHVPAQRTASPAARS